MCVGDIVEIVPGGTDDWGIGIVVFQNGKVVDSENMVAKYFPRTFVEPVEWSPPSGDSSQTVDTAGVDESAPTAKEPETPVVEAAEPEADVVAGEAGEAGEAGKSSEPTEPIVMPPEAESLTVPAEATEAITVSAEPTETEVQPLPDAPPASDKKYARCLGDFSGDVSAHQLSFQEGNLPVILTGISRSICLSQATSSRCFLEERKTGVLGCPRTCRGD